MVINSILFIFIWKETMKGFLKCGFFMLLGAAIFGCHSAGNDIDYVGDKYIKSHNIVQLEKKLANKNIRIFHGGNSTVLVLPAKYFFVGSSANFAQGISKVLELIFSLTGYYDTPSISIIGFSKDARDPAVGKAIAKERASRIGHYLWRAGIASNFICADGRSNFYFNGNKKEIQVDAVLIEIRETE